MYFCRCDNKKKMPDNCDSRHKIYSELIETHKEQVRNMCVARSHGEEDLTRELIHECYLAIWNHMGSLRVDSHEGERRKWVAWQCKSVFLRRWSRRRKTPILLAEEGLEPQVEDEGSREMDMVLELSAELNLRELELLHLILQGYGTQEIADVLGIKAASVSVERSRLVKKMSQRAEKLKYK